jgi:hypothetical protein
MAAVLVTAAAMAVTMAAERATFILTNGEKVSGTVVFHTEERTNIRADKNEFNVGLVNGTEAAIPFHQVALIDFAGGTPSQAELAALRNDAHMLAMRNGSTRQGKLVDLIGGDTVRWRNPGGDTQDVPIRESARVYLNVDASRTIFNYKPTAAPDPEPQMPSGGFEVRANVQWNDTGLTVRRGERIRFQASGEIRFRGNETASPEGNDAVRNPRFPVAEMPVGALIGKVGSMRAFPIGTNNTVVMPATGRLMLGVNDDTYGDNSGAFRVVITRVR